VTGVQTCALPIFAAARGIVETHGGEILVRSEPNRGSTFLIAFPVAPEAPPDRKTPEYAKRVTPGTVLLAEDENDVREIVGAMLRSSGYGVIEARDGIEALEMFRGRSGEIDLVIVDLMMPRMSGEQAFAEMRRIRPGVRGLLASGYDESGRILEIVESGFGGFLQKPFRMRELVAKVEEIIGRRERGEDTGDKG
jgi:CheY-like chemotaxis protein